MNENKRLSRKVRRLYSFVFQTYNFIQIDKHILVYTMSTVYKMSSNLALRGKTRTAANQSIYYLVIRR